eukprot:3619207-Karenia_brevis.AAC.1
MTVLTIIEGNADSATLVDVSQKTSQSHNEGDWARVDSCSACHICRLTEKATSEFLAPIDIQDAQPIDNGDDTNDELQAELAQRQIMSEWLCDEAHANAKQEVSLAMRIQGPIQKSLHQ